MAFSWGQRFQRRAASTPRTVGLVRESVVIDMLRAADPRLGEPECWQRKAGAFDFGAFQKLRESGVTVFHPAVDLNARGPLRPSAIGRSTGTPSSVAIRTSFCAWMGRRTSPQAPRAAERPASSWVFEFRPLPYRQDVAYWSWPARLAAHLQCAELDRGGLRSGARLRADRLRRTGGGRDEPHRYGGGHLAHGRPN